MVLAGTGSGVSSVIAKGLAERLHGSVRPTNSRFCIADIGNGSPHRGQAMNVGSGMRRIILAVTLPQPSPLRAPVTDEFQDRRHGSRNPETRADEPRDTAAQVCEHTP